MNRTPIEWCDYTVNPIRFRNKETGKVGHYCENISPACANCYASRMQKGPYLSGLEFRAENRNKGELFFDESVLQQVLRRRKPGVIFWCHMTDLFGDWVPNEWIDRCAAVVALTPNLKHLWLTKRAKRMREYFSATATILRIGPKILDGPFRNGQELPFSATYPEGRPDGPFDGTMPRVELIWPLPNLGLGVSPHDQKSADEMIPELLATPAAMRFVSLEPLLGAVDIHKWALPNFEPCICHPMLDWVICGGESGPGARPCDVQWIRSIVRQGRDAKIPVFIKQTGTNTIVEACRQQHFEWGEGKFEHWENDRSGFWRVKLRNSKGSDSSEWPDDLRVRQRPEGWG